MKKSITLVILLSALFVAFADVNAQKPEKTDLVLEAVAPVLPSILVAAFERGRTTVEVIVGEDGQVKSIGEVKAPTPLRRALTAAARKWRFAPVDKGSGVRKIELVFVLKMVSSDAKSEELFFVFRPPYEVEIRVRAPIVSEVIPNKTGRRQLKIEDKGIR